MGQQHSRLLTNASLNVAAFCWTIGLSLFAVSYVVRVLGTEEYGLYGLIVFLLSPVSVANLSFPEATMRSFARSWTLGAYKSCAEQLQTSLWVAMVVGISGMAFLLAFGLPLLAVFFRLDPIQEEMLATVMQWVALDWLMLQLIATYQVVPTALQRFGYLSCGNIVTSSITALLGVVAVGKGFGLEGYVISVLLGDSVACVVWVLIGRLLFDAVPLWPRFYRTRWLDGITYGKWRALSQVGGILAGQIERVLLGVFIGPSAVGIYHTVIRLEQNFVVVVFKLAEVFFPLFAAESGEPQSRRTQSLFRLSWLNSVAATLILVPLLFFAEQILTYWIDAQFARQGAWMLQLITVGGLLGSGANAAYFYLLGNAYSQPVFILSVTTGLVTVLAATLLLPHYGMSGVGVPGIIAMLIQAILLFVILKATCVRTLRLGDYFGFIYGPIASGIIVALVVYLGGVCVPTDVIGMALFALAAGISLLTFLYLTSALFPGHSIRMSDLKLVLKALKKSIVATRL